METISSQPLDDKNFNETKRLEVLSIESDNATQLTSDGKNGKHIKCLRCPSTILVPDMAELVTSEFSLPAMKKTDDEKPTETNCSNQFWCVENMYTFENIGFSKTVDGIKYLICADCEIGPIGYHDLNTNLSYVSLGRVKHC